MKMNCRHCIAVINDIPEIKKTEQNNALKFTSAFWHLPRNDDVLVNPTAVNEINTVLNVQMPCSNPVTLSASNTKKRKILQKRKK
jgi:hypothetical protein